MSRFVRRPLAAPILAFVALAAAILPVTARPDPPAATEAGGPAPAAATAAPEAPSSIHFREEGEESQIERRLEWFLSRRRAGASGDGTMARLRRLAFEETARRIAVQRDRAAAGVDVTNFWSAMGPSASHFGGWAFGDVAGRITALARGSDGALYAAGAAGGLWKTVNDGLSWTPLFDAAGTETIGAIAVDPSNPAVLWAGTGDFVYGCEGYFGIGLLRSADGGLTWAARNGTGGSTLEDLSNFSSVVVDPRDGNHLVVGGLIRGCSSGTQQVGGLYTTADGGLTWTKRLADTQIHEIAQDPVTQDTWWAATNKGIYKSTNNAVTWTLQTASGLPNGSTDRTELAISPSAPQTVYALFASNNEFWRTTNGGTSWTRMSTGACDGQCTYNMVIRVHPTNPNIVYRGTILLFKSLDGGATWSSLTPGWGSSQKVHQDTHTFLTVASNPEWLYVGSDGGVWKTIDGGANFTNLNSNLHITQFYAIGVHGSDPGIICGGAQDNSSLARNGASNVWDLQQVTGDGFVCHIDPVDPTYSYVTSYPSTWPQVYRSTTGVFGIYSVVTGSGSGIESGDREDWVTPYIVDPRTSGTLYLGTQRVYKSVDHGTSWTSAGPADMTGGSGTVISLEVNRNFPSIVLAGTSDGRVWRSADAGASWTNITAGLPARTINDVAADPTDPNRAFAVVGGFGTAHLWEHTVSGGWVPRAGGLPNVPANTVLVLTATELFVGNDVGVFRSTDGGVTFTPFMNGLPQGLVVTDLKFHPASGTLTAGTYGRGAWQVALDPVQPIVIFDSIALPMTPVDGDGDAAVEPGETWRVTPVLRNAGGLTAQGVSASLSTAAPGVTLVQPTSLTYGTIAGGATASAPQPIEFTVGPGFTCGGPVAFDVTNITSTNAPFTYSAASPAFTIPVLDHLQPDVVTALLDEDFDPTPPSGWTHDLVNPNLPGCSSFVYKDDWKLRTKDAAHGQSYISIGASTSYLTTEYGWLRFGGRDSTNGPGILLPSGVSIQLTLTHWYSTQSAQDGGLVAADVNEDNLDVYTTLVPNAGYPGSLTTGLCNGLEGNPAFTGNSGGWRTDTFDLTSYGGRRIYLAFVFGSDRFGSGHEGWYVDTVKVEYLTPGSPVCQVTLWPGEVAGTALFSRLISGDVTATWPVSCNAVAVPGQTYSIQAGDLASLHATGSYTHAPIAGACARTSPATFTPGAGSQYYLVVPNASASREGSAGAASSGAPRPQPSAACGGRHADACVP